MKLSENIINQIKEYRIKHNLTQEEFGEMIGMKQQQLARIEAGADFRISTAERILEILEKDI